MMLVLLSALTMGMTGVSGATNTHETVTFDYGWRFHLGELGPSPPTPPPPNCSSLNNVFPTNVSNIELMGLTKMGGIKDPLTCAQNCCSLGRDLCWAWQFNESKGCWSGFFTGNTTRAGWVGASRGHQVTPPPTAPPAPILPDDPEAAQPGFDDSTWSLIDLPHDYIVEGEYDPDTPSDQGPKGNPGGAGKSYLPRDIGYYRKHFTLPQEWQGNAIWIQFDGVFRATRTWLNGEPIRDHAGFPGDAHGEGGGVGMGGGYTSFTAKIDNVSSIQYGPNSKNVLTVYVDPREGSGWFYEGGGIYRKTYLHSAPKIHIDTDGVDAHGVVSGSIFARETPHLGVSAESASVNIAVDIVNTMTSLQSVSAEFFLYDESEDCVGETNKSSSTLPPALNRSAPSSTMVTASIVISNPELWSIARPYLYKLRVELSSGDSVNVTIGMYTTNWTGDQGLLMNSQHVKVRGFCNHESFGGVGMAIPDRVNLFRAQTLRSVGGNGWRMSHNPVTPGLYDILDRVGIVAMDETREMNNGSISIMNMGAMVRRDRNHPSIIIWSFCNEAGCREGADGLRNITLRYDKTRPTLGNSNTDSAMDPYTDVEGFSHRDGHDFDTFHALYPNRPTFASECCSCGGQRSNTQGGGLGVSSPGQASCTAGQSNRSNSRDFVVGTMVWTLFDYYGESGGWPKVSSPYGQVDLAGFMKTTGWWYRTWWLSAVPMNDAGRPTGFGLAPTCHPYWESGTLYVLTEANEVMLYQDGNHTDTAEVLPLIAASFSSASTEAKNTTVACIDHSGTIISSETLILAQNASAIKLSIDAPSTATGTGSSLYLDGHDVALLRATIVDSDGVAVDSDANVSFTVTNGPGRILATHNGDPACHEPNHASWHSAFVGLVRCIVQVTEDRSGTIAARSRLASIDKESAFAKVIANDTQAAATISVTASSPGLRSDVIEIPVSSEVAHSVLQAAQNSRAIKP